MSEPDTPGKGAPGRREALRHLLNRHQLRESVTRAPQSIWGNSAVVGLQAALTSLLVLPLVHLSPWPHLIGYAALGALIALFGRFAPRAARGGILLRTAFWQVFAVLSMSAAVWLGAPIVAQLVLLALLCGVFSFVTTAGRFGAPGALIFVFAAGASLGPVESGQDLVQRGLATALGAALALTLCLLTERLRQPADPAAPPEAALPTLDHRVFAAARISVAAALAALAAWAAGAQHPAWAAMGAVAVLQGVHLHVAMNRALQRMLGTVVGALLVWLLLLLAPSVGATILVIAALQVLTEVIIGMNYALGQIFVTPMALLMTYLASHGAAGPAMATERILDTLVGALIGLVLAILFSGQDDRAYLARHHAVRQRR